MFSIKRFLPKQIINSTKILKLETFPFHKFQIKRNHSSTINLENFRKMVRYYETNTIGLNILQKKIKYELNKLEPNISPTELKELICISKTDDDIDFIGNLLTHLVNLNRNLFQTKSDSKPFDLLLIFMQLLFVLKKCEKSLEIFDALNSKKKFLSHLAFSYLLNSLLEEKRYDDIVSCCIKRIETNSYLKRKLKEYISNDEKFVNKNNEVNQKNDYIINIPYDHIEIFTRALLNQNSNSAFDNFKELFNYILKNDGNIDDFFILRLLWFSIEKNEVSFAIDLLIKSGISNKIKNSDLLRNIRLILTSKQEKVSDAIGKLIFLVRNNKTIYPYTFKCLKEDAKKFNNKDYMDQIDILFKRVALENENKTEDLSDIVFASSFDLKSTKEDDVLHSDEEYFGTNNSNPINDETSMKIPDLKKIKTKKSQN